MIYRFVHFNHFQLLVFTYSNCRRGWKEFKGWLNSSRYEAKETICLCMIYLKIMKHLRVILDIPTFLWWAWK